MTQGLTDRKIAVITGGGSGLGAALAERAAADGLTVILADRNEQALKETVSSLSANGAEVCGITTDVSDPAAVDSLAAEVLRRFGPPSLLVNNAGIELIGPIWEFSAEELNRIVQVNVLGAMQMVRAFAPAMIAGGQPSRIANFASVGALGIMPFQTAYILTKQAVIAYSEGLELELRETAPQIKVSVVLPGPVSTSIFELRSPRAPQAAALHSTLQSMLAQAMPAQEAAGIIMGMLQEGRFWVSSHPEQLAHMAAVRGAAISVLEDPSLSDDAKAVIKGV